MRFFAILIGTAILAPRLTLADDTQLENALDRIRSLEEQVATLQEKSGDQGTGQTFETALTQPPEDLWSPRYYVDYDNGLVLRPFDKEATPFELKIGIRLQFRYTGFNRDRETYSNNGDASRGGPLLVRNRNDFEIERSRLIFRGFMFDPKLKYFVNLDADTDDGHRVRVHDFWVYYEFSDAFILNVGKGMVPGSRDWLSLSPNTHIADRSMATTFFRPDRTIGVWARGELCDDLFYHVMLGNGVNTNDLPQSEVDERFAYSMSSWWEPLGEVGKGHADLKYHEDAVVRLGHSFTYASQTDKEDGASTGEEAFVRLSDGTRLVTPGALAAGVTVDQFNYYLYSIDAAYKYRGFSANAEFFLRWLNSFETTGGTIPHSELFDRGFYVDAGYFLVPKKLEVAALLSHVNGLFGDSWEYAAGINYFVTATHFNKLTFDVSVLDGSPTSNNSTNHFVGQDGVMFRFQYQVQY